MNHMTSFTTFWVLWPRRGGDDDPGPSWKQKKCWRRQLLWSLDILYRISDTLWFSSGSLHDTHTHIIYLFSSNHVISVDPDLVCFCPVSYTCHENLSHPDTWVNLCPWSFVPSSCTSSGTVVLQVHRRRRRTHLKLHGNDSKRGNFPLLLRRITDRLWNQISWVALQRCGGNAGWEPSYESFVAADLQWGRRDASREGMEEIWGPCCRGMTISFHPPPGGLDSSTVFLFYTEDSSGSSGLSRVAVKKKKKKKNGCRRNCMDWTGVQRLQSPCSGHRFDSQPATLTLLTRKFFLCKQLS